MKQKRSLNASLASAKLLLQVFIFWIKYELGDYMSIIYENVGAGRTRGAVRCVYKYDHKPSRHPEVTSLSSSTSSFKLLKCAFD